MTTYLGFDCANKSLAWSHVTIDTSILVKLAVLLPDLRQCVSNVSELGANDTAIAHAIGVIGRFRSVMSGFFTYHSAGVVDLLDGAKLRDTDEIERTMALHEFLANLDANMQVDIATKNALKLSGTPIMATAMQRDAVASSGMPIMATAMQRDAVASSGMPVAMAVIIEHQNNIGMITNRASTIVSAQLAYHYVSRDISVDYIDPSLKNKLILADHLDIKDYVVRELPKHKKPSDARYIANKKHSRDSFVYVLELFGHGYVIESTRKYYLDDLADSTMEILAVVKKEHLLAQMLFLSEYSYL